MMINAKLQLNTTKLKFCKDEINTNLLGEGLLTKGLRY